MDELQTYVLYDIRDDSTRTRVAEVCKDYGLERIQFSAFSGSLSRNRREELFLRLEETLGDRPGKILVQPVCEKDFRANLTLEQDGPDGRKTEADAPRERPEAV
ncbi:CRISPR-associated endonuclease Cas2 [Candidatus Nitrospira bockiana]